MKKILKFVTCAGVNVDDGLWRVGALIPLILGWCIPDGKRIWDWDPKLIACW